MRYWQHELRDAEIVIGKSQGKLFSKSEAVNNAAKHAKGRIFVILDADVYFDGRVIQYCADAIDEATRRGHRLWFVPYRHLFRLTRETTTRVLESNPHNPLRFSSPPSKDDVLSTEGSMHGHRYGAMIQIMPREAFFEVGGMDPRFRGWGGEDVAFLRALDTMWNNHKSTDNDVLHLWHPKIGETFNTRMWEGQRNPRVNEKLAWRYSQATGDKVRMRNLVNEGLNLAVWKAFLYEMGLIERKEQE